MKQSALSQFAQEASEETHFTPDIATLNRQAYQPIFIYDRMKYGFSDQKLLGNDMIYMGPAYTIRNDLELWVKKLNKESFPIILEGEEEPGMFDVPVARIKGDFFFTPTKHIISLDEMNTNGLHCERVLMPLVIPYRTIEKGETEVSELKEYVHEAWIYIGERDFFGRQLKELFHLAEKFRSRGGIDYYQFTEKDMNAI